MAKVIRKSKTAQQSVHLTLGILRKSQAVSYAFSLFWLDGFAAPAPAQVTQAVRPLRQHYEVNDPEDGKLVEIQSAYGC